MNQDEAKNILLLYRPGTVDADDPQIVEALALAKREPELARWLEENTARQNLLRDKFRQVTAPAGLKEQIISEQAAQGKMIFRRKNFALAAAAVIVALVTIAPFWFRPHASDDTLGVYQNRMAGFALRGYAMDFETKNLTEIRAYLAKKNAPSDFALPASLEKVEVAGTAIENWQNTTVSMICFRTGKPLPPGQQSDLWLFVVDRDAVKQISDTGSPQFSKNSRLATAVWIQGDKLYLLETEGDEQAIRKFL